MVSFTQHDFCDGLISQCLYQNLFLFIVPLYGYATMCLPILWLLALESFLAFCRGRLSCCDPLCASLFLNIDCFFLGEILGVELLEDMFSPAKGVWFCTSSSTFGIFDL